MDLQMPGMNGYDAAGAICAMTANAFAEDVHAAKTAGMNAPIAKPLDRNTLA